MTYIPHGPKKPVNMSLSEDLVRDASHLTTNLSDTVEKLLTDFVAAEQRRRADKEQRIDETINILNEHEIRHGVWGEEYATL